MKSQLQITLFFFPLPLSFEKNCIDTNNFLFIIYVADIRLSFFPIFFINYGLYGMLFNKPTVT